MIRKEFTLILFLILFQSILLSNSAYSKKLDIEGNYVWHWYGKLRFNQQSLNILSDCGIKGIFINAGYFYIDKTGQVQERDKDKKTGDDTDEKGVPEFETIKFNEKDKDLVEQINKFQIHLVYTFESYSSKSFVYDYFEKETDKAVEFILKMIENNIFTFQNMGFRVDGIQFDLEGNIDFDKYASLLKGAKKRFGKKYTISFCPIASWLHKDNFKSMIKHIDFMVPMFYDFKRPKDIEGISMITNVNWLEKMTIEFERLKTPFLAGLPTYTYRLYFNEEGKRIFTWGWISPDELSESKTFQFIKAKNSMIGVNNRIYNGDNIYLYRVMNSVNIERFYLPEGSHIMFDTITPQGVKIYIETVYKNRKRNLKGICLFRFATATESNIINIDQFPFIFLDSEYYPKPEVEFAVQKTGKRSACFSVTMRNTGCMETMPSEDSNQIIMKIYNANIKNITRNNFDRIEHFSQTGTGVQQKFDYLILGEKLVDKGEIVVSGPIELQVHRFPVIIEYQAWLKGLDGKIYGLELTKWRRYEINR